MNPYYCPITYSFGISPSITDASVVVLNTRTFTVKSNDLSLAGAYEITITALSPNGVASSAKLKVSLALVNPCLTSSFTITSNIIAATTTYILADIEFSFPEIDLNKITSNN